MVRRLLVDVRLYHVSKVAKFILASVHTLVRSIILVQYT
jgi:hypothetical protein